MTEYLALFSRSKFPEAIEIQLSDKGWKIAMLKVFGEYFLSQFCHIFDDEAITLGCPLNSSFMGWVLDNYKIYIDYSVSFGKEYGNRVQYFLFLFVFVFALHLTLF